MKKKVFGRQLSRESSTRRALFRSLMRALILNGKIKTTKAKAKAIQTGIEKVVTLGKKDRVAYRRRMYSILGGDKVTTDFLVKKVCPVFSMKASGFTRLVNLPRRFGDNAQMVRLEWTESIEKYVKPARSKVKKNKIEDAKPKKAKGIKKFLGKKNNPKISK